MAKQQPTFSDNIERRPGSDCWVWLGGHSSGYGVFWDGKKAVRAHRKAYEEEYGSIPGGFHVHHKCGQRNCVRPDHLKAVIRSQHSSEHRLFRSVDKLVALVVAGHSDSVIAKRVQTSVEQLQEVFEGVEFQAKLRKKLVALALRRIARYFAGELSREDAKLAFDFLNKMGSSEKSPSGSSARGRPAEEETDLSEFSKEQLQRLEGDA